VVDGILLLLDNPDGAGDGAGDDGSLLSLNSIYMSLP